jgi:hypothetical protein
MPDITCPTAHPRQASVPAQAQLSVSFECVLFVIVSGTLRLDGFLPSLQSKEYSNDRVTYIGEVRVVRVHGVMRQLVGEGAVPLGAALLPSRRAVASVPHVHGQVEEERAPAIEGVGSCRSHQISAPA